MNYGIGTLNERVWRITQPANLSFHHLIGRTHSWHFSMFYKNRTSLTISGTPPETLTKGGHCFSPTAMSIFSIKSCPNQNLQRVASYLDTFQPSRVYLFFRGVYSGWTRLFKSGVWASTPFWHAYARLFPAVSTKVEMFHYMVRLSPFLARCGLVCPVMPQKHWQWAMVPPCRCRGTTTRLRLTSKRATTVQTGSNVTSLP